MAKCCKGCLDRVPGCQDKCKKPEFLLAVEGLNKKHAAMKREFEANCAVYDGARRMHRRRRSKSGG